MRASVLHLASTHPEDSENFLNAEMTAGLKLADLPPTLNTIKRSLLPEDFIVFIQAEDADEIRRKNDPLSEFINIDALPAPIRNFVRLQNEISGREVGQMEAVISPVTITAFTSPASKLFEKKRRKEEWDRYVFLLYLQFYNELFTKTWLKIEVTRAKLEAVKEELLAVKEDTAFNNAAEGLQEKIDTFLKKDLKTYEERLQDTSRPPSEEELIQINQEIDEKIERLSISAKILRVLGGSIFLGLEKLYLAFYLNNLSHTSEKDIARTLRNVDPVVFTPENLKDLNLKSGPKKEDTEKEEESIKPPPPPPADDSSSTAPDGA